MPTETNTRLFEVTTKDLEGLPDARGESVRSMLKADHGIDVLSVRVILGYQVRSDVSEIEAESLIYDLFADPVIEVGSMDSRILDDFRVHPKQQSRSASSQASRTTRGKRVWMAY